MGDLKAMKKRLLSNALFILILGIVVLAFIGRNQNIDIDIISDPDVQLAFSTGDILDQTWQSNVKKISEIVLPYSSKDSFEGEIKVELISDERGEIIADSVQSMVFAEGENGLLTFSFKPFSLDLGTRCRIRLYYTNSSAAGSIYLPANSNYGGCCINGNEINQAVGLTIRGIKTNSISFLVIACFPFLSFSFLFMMIWKRKWEETIGLSFIFTTLIMVFAGICEILPESIYLIYILSTVSIFAAIWLYNRNKLQIKDLLSPGLFVFLVFLVFVIVNCKDLYFSRSDEFTFWGLAVKDMYYFDSLSKHANTVVYATYYPPFMLCIEYFFVYINAFFADRVVYIGCQLMLISCLMVSCKDAVKKPKIVILSIVASFIAPLLFYDDIFSTIYADAALAVFVAYVLVCYFTEEMSGFNLWRIIGGLAALTFTKPTGVVLAGLITLMIIGDVFLKQRKKREYHIKKFLMPCFLTIMVCCFYCIWQVYLKIPVKVDNLVINAAENTAGKTAVKTVTSASGITFGNIIDFLLLRGEQYRYDVLKVFLKTIFIGDSFNIGNMSFSYLELLLLFFLLIWLFARGLEKDKRNKALRFGILSCLAGICYSGFLLTTYLFSFSRVEALNLAHHGRYLLSWICGFFIAFLVLVIHNIADRKEDQSKSVNICIFLIISLIFIAPTGKLLDRRSDTTHMEQYAYGYEKTAEVARSFGNRAEQIYFVGEITGHHMFTYALCPMKVALSSEAPELSKWEKELKDYQYVFLLNTDDKFKEEYKGLFESSDKILDASFYQVKMDGEDILLQYIGTTKAMQNQGE